MGGGEREICAPKLPTDELADQLISWRRPSPPPSHPNGW